jgi:N-acetylglutamate synthase-like GNAT family acetyltransferase
MKLVRWKRFTWDLTKLPAEAGKLPEHYRIRPAAREDERTVRAVIGSSFALDMNWSDTLKAMEDWLAAQLDTVFEHKVAPCLVVTHGVRIIGASAFIPDKEAEFHFVSGPCILNEYRNRGIGTELLFATLSAFRDLGFDKVHAITKANVPVAKFVYTKFGSTSEPCEFEPVAAKALRRPALS